MNTGAEKIIISVKPFHNSMTICKDVWFTILLLSITEPKEMDVFIVLLYVSKNKQ